MSEAVSFTCPQGHQSTTSDFCDVCGEPITSSGAAPAAEPPVACPPRAHQPGAHRAKHAGRSGTALVADVAATGRRADPGVPQLRGGEPGRRALLRSVRLRLHHRPAAVDDPAHGRPRRGLGGGGVDRPRLVRVSGQSRRLRDERAPDDRPHPRHERTRRPALPQPRDHTRDRLRERRRSLAPPRAAHTGPRTLVGGGSRLHERHVRRRARRAAPEDSARAPATPRARRRRTRVRRRVDRIVVRRATDDEKAARPS